MHLETLKSFLVICENEVFAAQMAVNEAKKACNAAWEAFDNAGNDWRELYEKHQKASKSYDEISEKNFSWAHFDKIAFIGAMNRAEYVFAIDVFNRLKAGE